MQGVVFSVLRALFEIKDVIMSAKIGESTLKVCYIFVIWI